MFADSAENPTMEFAIHTFEAYKCNVTITYAKIKLSKNLPHMFLDAKCNNHLGLSNIPLVWLPKQHLSLEGNFDTYYTLYCPRGYETDALYIFTPDFMSFLIDNAADYDIEIVDNHLYIYKSGRTAWTPHTLGTLATVADLVTQKLANRSRNYSDYRVSPADNGTIATKGRRLGIVKPIIVTTAVSVLLYAIAFAVGFFG